MATLELSAGLTISCSVIFIPASALMLGLRFYARHRQKVDLGLDDWLMVPAFIFLLGMQIDMIVGFGKRTIGYPDPDFAPGKADAATNLPFWPFELMQVPALAFVKLSIVFFYRRIFHTGQTSWHHWITASTLGILTAWAVSYFFAFLFICGGTPAHYWDSAQDEKAFCVATQKLHLSFSVSDMILDCIVILLSVPMVWTLHMSTSRKFAVTGVFGLGLITVAASVTRMTIFVQATALRYDPDLDFEYLDTDVIYWSMLETGLSFLTANSIIVYSLLAKSSLSARLRSLRPLLFSTGLREESQEIDTSIQLSERKGKLPNSTNTSTPGASGGDDTNSSWEGRHIYVQREYGGST